MRNLWKKNIAKAFAVGLSLAASVVCPLQTEAAEGPTNAEQKTENPANTQGVYSFVSDYDYGMLCPHKPVGIIPASQLYGDDRKGDVLIFENEGYNIKHAWVILVDAFDTKAVPDFNKISEKDAETYLEKLMHSSGYEGISLVNLTQDNKAVFGITAKEVEIDTDGDGVMDARAVAETQEAVVFFRTSKGKCIAMHLIDNPILRKETVGAFQYGASTLHDLDAQALKKALVEEAKQAAQQREKK